MRNLITTCLLLAFVSLTSPAAADQTDARLKLLFEQLKDVSEPVEAGPIERQIWTIWHETKDPEVEALMKTGVASMNRGEFDAALEAFDKVVVLAPKFAEGWNRRATLHYFMGSFELSLKDIAKTLELEPRHFGALSGRGLVYTRLEDLERALDAFEAALEVYPQMIGPRNNAEAIRKILKKREI